MKKVLFLIYIFTSLSFALEMGTEFKKRQYVLTTFNNIYPSSFLLKEKEGILVYKFFEKNELTMKIVTPIIKKIEQDDVLKLFFKNMKMIFFIPENGKHAYIYDKKECSKLKKIQTSEIEKELSLLNIHTFSPINEQ